MHITGTIGTTPINLVYTGQLHLHFTTIEGLTEMAATVQQILDKVSELAVSVSNVRSDVQSLKDQLLAGGMVTQADLDNILAQLTTVSDQAAQLDSETP